MAPDKTTTPTPVAYKTCALIYDFRTVRMPNTNFLLHPRSPQKSVSGLIPLCKVTHSSRTAKTITHKGENTGCSWQGGEKTAAASSFSAASACSPPSHYLMTSPSVLIGNYFAGFNAFIQTVSVESGEKD